MSEIQRIELPTIFGMKTVNAYLQKGDEVVLIDSGENTDESYAALTAGLKENGLTVADIDRVVITHAHVDHMGMAQRIGAEANARIWVSELVKDWAIKPDEMWSTREKLMLPTLLSYFDPTLSDLIKQGYVDMMGNVKKVWQPISKDQLEVYQSDGQLDINDTRWQCVYMPGHSSSQTTFFNPINGDYISADMLLRITPTPVIEPSRDDMTKRNKGILEMMNSYERLLRFDIKKVYPGHYETFENAHDVINKQVRRIDERTKQCYELIKSGQSSFIDIFNILYEGRFNMPAMIMLIGYLDRLENAGVIMYKERDGFLQIFTA